MNGVVFWRLVWKEYRMQRAFWIAMAGLAVVVNLIVLGYLQWKVIDGSEWLFRAALGLGAFYALGCGATLFATEHESETFPFQRALPVSPLRLFAAKVTFALLSSAAMLGAMWLLAAVFSGWRLLDPHDEFALWGLWGMAAVELLAWGVLFSLLTTRPLVAVILAVSCASLTVELLRGGTRTDWDLNFYVDALPWRALVVSLLALADVWLGYRWFREPRVRTRSAARDKIAGDQWFAPGQSSAFFPFIAASHRSLFTRLVWHHVRQSAPLLITFILLAAPVAIVILLGRYDPAIVRAIERTSALWLLPMFFSFAVFLTPPLMGASVFLADQSRSSFRFLAERGADPRLVWLSRQLVWFVPLVVGAVAVVAPIPFPSGVGREPTLYLFGYAVLGYACGQFFSMFLRSGILASVFAIALTLALCFWSGLMYVTQMSWWWSVAPVPVALLVCTWLRAGDWLVERPGMMPMLRACWPLGLVTAGILTAVPTVRVYEVPYVDPGFSPAEFARPRTADEEATLAVYRQALRALDAARGPVTPTAAAKALAAKDPARLTPEAVAQTRAFESAVAFALEASRHAAGDFFTPAGDDVSPADVNNLAVLLWRSADRLEIVGRLDAALERCLGALRIAGHLRHRSISYHPVNVDWLETSVYDSLRRWSARPGQTSGRVLAAIRQLNETIAKLPSRADTIKSNYLTWLGYFQAEPQALMANQDTRNSFALRLLVRLAFWERARSLRILNLWTASALTAYERAEQTAAAGNTVTLTPLGPEFRERWRGAIVEQCGWASESLARSLDEGLVKIETERRTTRLFMALEAWKLDHGKLPDSLEKLQPKYLDRIPIEPVSGRPFGYVPQGLPSALPPDDLRGPGLAPGQPYILIPPAQRPQFGPMQRSIAESGPPPVPGATFFPGVATQGMQETESPGWALPIP